jgi:hypothetical protein
MAHFAQLNDDNLVVSVVVVNNRECLDANGEESEQVGIDYCANLFGGRWMQTSFNGTFRKRFAAIGYSYDAVRDAFIPPRPFLSWTFNEDSYEWQPPIAQPTNALHSWDEKNQCWQLTNE